MKHISRSRSVLGPSIAVLANQVLKRLGEETLLVGNPGVNSKIGRTSTNAIITRTNAMLVGMVVRELENEKAAHMWKVARKSCCGC